MNGLVKLLAGTYAFEQVVWARVASHLILVLLISCRAWRGDVQEPPAAVPIHLFDDAASFDLLFFGAVKYVGVRRHLDLVVAPLAVVFLAMAAATANASPSWRRWPWWSASREFWS
jgi:hypothetical protein